MMIQAIETEEELSARANAARAKARDSVDPEDRRAWLEIANEWTKLAQAKGESAKEK